MQQLLEQIENKCLMIRIKIRCLCCIQSHHRIGLPIVSRIKKELLQSEQQ